MGCSAVKSKGLQYGMVRESVTVVDEVLDTLELWCIQGSSISRDMVDGVYDIRAGV